jgi:hypothetical protein
VRTIAHPPLIDGPDPDLSSRRLSVQTADSILHTANGNAERCISKYFANRAAGERDPEMTLLTVLSTAEQTNLSQVTADRLREAGGGD